MNTRTRPRHRIRSWEHGDFVYDVDEAFTDDILLRTNELITGIGCDLRSVCIGHAPSELALNGGRNTGGGSEHGHLRFAIPQSWQWLQMMVNVSSLLDTEVDHRVHYIQGQPTAYIEITCSIRANTRNLSKRLRWWDVLLTELEQHTRKPSDDHPARWI